MNNLNPKPPKCKPDDAAALEALRTLVAWLGVTPAATSPADLLPLVEAARIAATSVRVLREAIRAGELRAYGGQRDRAVRRGDLDTWIASRAVAPHVGPDDSDIERRVARLRIVGGSK